MIPRVKSKDIFPEDMGSIDIIEIMRALKISFAFLRGGEEFDRSFYAHLSRNLLIIDCTSVIQDFRYPLIMIDIDEIQLRKLLKLKNFL
jgi:hypothetical protein